MRVGGEVGDKPEEGRAGRTRRAQPPVIHIVLEELDAVLLALEELKLGISNITSKVSTSISAENLGVRRCPNLIGGLELRPTQTLHNFARDNRGHQIIGKQRQDNALEILTHLAITPSAIVRPFFIYDHLPVEVSKSKNNTVRLIWIEGKHIESNFRAVFEYASYGVADIQIAVVAGSNLLGNISPSAFGLVAACNLNEIRQANHPLQNHSPRKDSRNEPAHRCHRQQFP